MDIVFTTAVLQLGLHWHCRFQHIRGNIRALVEMLLMMLDGFEAQGIKLLSDCYDCIKEPVYGVTPRRHPFCIKVEATERV